MNKNENKYIAGNIELLNVNYEINYNAEDKVAIITPSFSLSAKETFPLAVSVLLDNHELLPPALVKAQKQKIIDYKLKELKIFRPTLHQDIDDDDVHCYLMSLQLFAANSDEPLIINEQRVYIIG